MIRMAGIVLMNCALAVALVPVVAHAQHGHSHSHGIGKLAVAVDGAVLTLRLVVPLDDLVGFERAPRDDKERERVRSMAATIRKTEQMFAPTAAAGCALTSLKLASPVLDPALLGSSDSPPATTKESSGHAELTTDISYRCKEPAQLKNLEVNLFDAFKKVRRLDVSRIGASGQKAVRLTAKARSVPL